MTSTTLEPAPALADLPESVRRLAGASFTPNIRRACTHTLEHLDTSLAMRDCSV